MPHLLDDLLQLPVLSLQLTGLLLVVVVGGRAGLQCVLLLRLPLAAGDEAPHLHSEGGGVDRSIQLQKKKNHFPLHVKNK